MYETFGGRDKRHIIQEFLYKFPEMRKSLIVPVCKSVRLLTTPCDWLEIEKTLLQPSFTKENLSSIRDCWIITDTHKVSPHQIFQQIISEYDLPEGYDLPEDVIERVDFYPATYLIEEMYSGPVAVMFMSQLDLIMHVDFKRGVVGMSDVRFGQIANMLEEFHHFKNSLLSDEESSALFCGEEIDPEDFHPDDDPFKEDDEKY